MEQSIYRNKTANLSELLQMLFEKGQTYCAQILLLWGKKSKKISNDQELIQSDPTSCPQNQKGNN